MGEARLLRGALAPEAARRGGLLGNALEPSGSDGDRIRLHPQEHPVLVVDPPVKGQVVEEVVRARVVPPADVVLLCYRQVGVPHEHAPEAPRRAAQQRLGLAKLREPLDGLVAGGGRGVQHEVDDGWRGGFARSARLDAAAVAPAAEVGRQPLALAAHEGHHDD